MRRRGWGVTEHEADASLPGDSLVPDADVAVTRVTTVLADAERIWPWIARIGQQGACSYRYDGLEQLMGCRKHSADRVHPEWQATALGGRERYRYEWPWAPLLVRPTRIVSTVMTRRMLLGVKRRAERRPAGPATTTLTWTVQR